MITGDPAPWHPLDLPWDEAPGWDGIPWDRDARPTLEEVLAIRTERQAVMSRVIDSLTEEQLASHISRTEPGWPKVENFALKECLIIVLTEEWEHRAFAERDLAKLSETGLQR
jgi:DinB superfamily